jgi:hypothetical protein
LSVHKRRAARNRHYFRHSADGQCEVDRKGVLNIEDDGWLDERLETGS